MIIWLSEIDSELILFAADVQVYYSTNPQQPLSQWESQFVDNNKLTTISDLTPHTIYTIRVEAYTSIGPGPLSNPVQVLSK
jgi:receptor-type tyrosine-protein phosphatase F